MRSFTITKKIEEGLAVTSEPYPHIAVGEPGRGRKLVRVALGRRDFPEGGVSHIDDVGIFQTQKGTLLVVKETKLDNRALVLLKTPPGFRGSVSWYALTRNESVTLDESPKVKLVAIGYCAQGMAGRAGGGPEYLAIIEPGTRLEVTRRGRLYGSDPVLHLVWDGEELSFGTPDVVCQVGFEEELVGKEL